MKQLFRAFSLTEVQMLHVDRLRNEMLPTVVLLFLVSGSLADPNREYIIQLDIHMEDDTYVFLADDLNFGTNMLPAEIESRATATIASIMQEVNKMMKEAGLKVRVNKLVRLNNTEMTDDNLESYLTSHDLSEGQGMDEKETMFYQFWTHNVVKEDPSYFAFPGKMCSKDAKSAVSIAHPETTARREDESLAYLVVQSLLINIGMPEYDSFPEELGCKCPEQVCLPHKSGFAPNMTSCAEDWVMTHLAGTCVDIPEPVDIPDPVTTPSPDSGINQRLLIGIAIGVLIIIIVILACIIWYCCTRRRSRDIASPATMTTTKGDKGIATDTIVLKSVKDRRSIVQKPLVPPAKPAKPERQVKTFP